MVWQWLGSARSSLWLAGLLALLLYALPATAQTEDTRPLDWLLTPVTAANNPRGGRVTDVAVRVLGERTALVTWATDVAVTDEINYGPRDRPMTPLLSFMPDTRHQVQLGNLLRGTVYQYAIAARDTVTGTFVTAGTPALRHERVLAAAPDARTLDLAWATNLPANFHVGLRLAGDTSWRAEQTGTTLACEQTVRFANLRPDAEYRYLIQSSGSSG